MPSSNSTCLLPSDIHSLPIPCSILSITDTSHLLIEDCNRDTSKILGLLQMHIIGKKLEELAPDILSPDSPEYQTILSAIHSSKKEIIKLYLPDNDLWLDVFVQGCSKNQRAAVFLQNITEAMKTVKAASNLLMQDSQTINYQLMCDHMLFISQARLVALNLYEPDGTHYHTAAIASSQYYSQLLLTEQNIQQGGKILSFDPSREKKTSKQLITTFQDIAESELPAEVTSILAKVMTVGIVVVLRIQHKGIKWGDFTLIFPPGKSLQNEPLLRLYAHQSAMMIDRWHMEKEHSRFQHIFENSHFGAVITDPQDRIRYVNPYFAHIHGYEPEDLLKTPLQNLFAQNAGEQIVVDSNVQAVEIWQRHRNGTTFPMLVNGLVFAGSDGLPEYHAITAIDLTERHRAELAMKEAMQQAEHANKAKSDFLSSMTHEIRTPLNGINGYTKLLQKTNLDETQHQYASALELSTTTLLTLVNDILDFSKIEAGRLSLAPEEIPLRQFLTDIHQLMIIQADTNKNKLLLETSQHLPETIFADHVRLQQIIVNLLSNAVKFTQEGTICLRVEQLSQQDKNGLFPIRFSVKDTGIGIPPNQQKLIFQSFTQADPGTTRKFGGTGLGLTISNRLLKLMASKMELQSTPGEGSEFSFVLHLPGQEKATQPAKPTQAAPAESKSKKESAIKTTKAAASAKMELEKSNYTVLIVDDDRINRRLASLLMKAILPDCNLFEANDGEKAVAAYLEHRPHLILMDVQMPLLNGYDASKKIRGIEEAEKDTHDYPPTIIIAVTAGIIETEKVLCAEAGMDDYVAKPIDEAKLRDTILQHMAKSS